MTWYQIVGLKISGSVPRGAGDQLLWPPRIPTGRVFFCFFLFSVTSNLLGRIRGTPGFPGLDTAGCRGGGLGSHGGCTCGIPTDSNTTSNSS